MSSFSILSVWPCIIGPLAAALLVCGLDDLVPTLIFVWTRFVKRQIENTASVADDEPLPERRIAIFVPCWKESGVISNMVRHNLAALCYRNFDFFLGVYPNDDPTVQVANTLANSFRNVHVALCPHDGPTSKADCLNWIYHRMLAHEEQHGGYFDTIVLHDAEDLIYPDALSTINRKRGEYAMVQVPVLPLDTPFREFTHGVYCDDFSEYQTIDMHARQWCGSFVPSCGVGTGFAREILDRLATEREGQVFSPASLTEDYEIGVYIHKLRLPQLFAPVEQGRKGLAATREYFPRRARSAIRQRTRWVTGIALQGWERYGWNGSWATRYWFWRDRKGLVTNPLSFLANIALLLGVADWTFGGATHRPPALTITNPTIAFLCYCTLTLQCLRLGLRMFCVGRLYSPVLAAGVPLRVLHGNFINCCASLGAIWRYLDARLHGRPLVWLKTEHAYPHRDALPSHRREFADVLTGSGYITEDKLTGIQKEMSPNDDLADFLVRTGELSDEDVCKIISLQSGLPWTRIDARSVKPRVVRSLPAHVEERFRIVPFGLQDGRLLIAGPRVPPSTMFDELRSFTKLPVEFQLVPEHNYRELRGLRSADHP
ncbi:MAG TPA: glycosyl transferase family protein [Bryobacteraceae bacterium]|nr:glycosyl transferase family protein [Bryobacteraceae bacterium]